MYYAYWLLAPNRYEIDLSDEVLCTLVDQEAAKILEAKTGGKKNYQLRLIQICRARGQTELADFFAIKVV